MAYIDQSLGLSHEMGCCYTLVVKVWSLFGLKWHYLQCEEGYVVLVGD